MMAPILTLHDPAQARAYYDAGHWQADTLYAMAAHHAAIRPDARALRDSRERLTWRQTVARADAIAGVLEDGGLRPGDRVGVWLPNRIDIPLVMLACSRNGYVCMPSLHQSHTVGEIKTLMERVDAAALIAQPGWGADADVSDIFAEITDVESMRLCLAPADTPAPAGVGQLPADGSRPAATAPSGNPDKVTYLAFTSGTTGIPKGVMHSDNTLIANGRAIVADWDVEPDERLFVISPLSHHIGTVAFEVSLASGAEMIVNDAPKRTSPLQRICEVEAGFVFGVPTHAMDLLAEQRRTGLARLGKVRAFYMAGASIPAEICRRILEQGIKPLNVYGMTENGSHQYTLPDDSFETQVNTCGKACAGFEVKIWNSDNPDIEAAPGEIGEIGSRGSLLMLGYFDNQRATERSFNRHGWFLSGDLGREDAEGNLQILGRSKDLIIRGGHNIYPSQIEALALKHADVLQAVAFPVPDDRLGEKVCLAVITHAGIDLDGEAMLAHLAEVGLSKFDMPEYFMAVESLPMTPSGKILKRELARQAREGEIAPDPVRWQPKMAETAKAGTERPGARQTT